MLKPAFDIQYSARFSEAVNAEIEEINTMRPRPRFEHPPCGKLRQKMRAFEIRGYQLVKVLFGSVENIAAFTWSHPGIVNQQIESGVGRALGHVRQAQRDRRFSRYRSGRCRSRFLRGETQRAPGCPDKCPEHDSCGKAPGLSHVRSAACARNDRIHAAILDVRGRQVGPGCYRAKA